MSLNKANEGIPSPFLNPIDTVRLSNGEELLTKMTLIDGVTRPDLLKNTFKYSLLNIDNSRSFFPAYRHGWTRHGVEFTTQALYLAADVELDEFSIEISPTDFPINIVRKDYVENGLIKLNRMKLMGKSRGREVEYPSSYLAYLALGSVDSLDEFVEKYGFLLQDLPSSLLTFKYAQFPGEMVFSNSSGLLNHNYFSRHLNGDDPQDLKRLYDSIELGSFAENKGNFLKYSNNTHYEALSAFRSLASHSESERYFIIFDAVRPKAVFESYYGHWLNSVERTVSQTQYEELVYTLQRDSDVLDYSVPNILTLYGDREVALGYGSNKEIIISPKPDINIKNWKN